MAGIWNICLRDSVGEANFARTITGTNQLEGLGMQFSLKRRSVMKALLFASAAPFVASASAFASSCDDGIVRIGLIAAPDTMNPFSTYESFWPLTFTYDWLVGVDAQRYPDRKGFAKEWEVSGDGLTWTFNIWPGMKWSDGHPATARDAAFTYNYLLNSIGKPDELSVGKNNTTGLQLISSVKAIDDETLQIVTKSPTRWPLDHHKYIVPEHIWKDISYADARGAFQNPAPLVGTGPMIVSEYKQGQYVRLEPNPYFRAGKPAAAGMIVNIFNSPDPIAQGLKNGDLDYGIFFTPAQWADLSKDPTIIAGQQRTEQRDFLAFNTTSGKGAGSTKALSDLAFRDALAYAIDQQKIVDRAYRKNAAAGIGVIPPVASDYYSDLNDVRRNFDLAEAARRLDAAGYRDADGDGVREDKDGKPIQLELLTGNASGNSGIPTAAVQLIAGWFGQIGIPVSVTQLEAGALTQRMASPERGGGGWDLIVSSDWPPAFATDLLRMGNSKLFGSSGNSAYWKSDEFDKLLAEIDVTVDLSQRKGLVEKAVRLLYTESPYVVLAYPYTLDARRKDCFEGWGSQDGIMSTNNYFPFDRLQPVKK